LGLKVAKEIDAVILSLDSLAIYKQIDIASAKPTFAERGDIVHFGIDEIYPNEDFNVTLFINLYKKAHAYALQNKKNLLLLGGTGFYLSILLDGISPMPKISKEAALQAKKKVQNIDAAYKEHLIHEPNSSIAKNDRYRLQKWYEFWFETGSTREEYFTQNPPQPIIKETIDIYEIEVEKEVLNERIKQRTTKMFTNGLVQEVENLVDTYGKSLKCFKAIGIKEVIEYLEGKCSLEEAKKLVTIHTRQLAKRQRTYNRSKFQHRICAKPSVLKELLLDAFQSE